MPEDIKPTFATNTPATEDGDGQSVGAAIRGHWEYLARAWAQPFSISIATAYINPGGFSTLRDGLLHAESVRLLIGADPDPEVNRVRSLYSDSNATERALEGHGRSMEEDRNLLGFTRESDAAARAFVDWARSEPVRVKRFERGFLHGKAYLVDTDHEGVIAGSSNFTYAGLNRNYELNLGHYDPHTVKAVSDWFDDMWNQANDFDLAALYEARFQPHSPYLIYLRMLWEKYGAEVEALANADGFGLHLADFQKDGVTMAKMILGRYSGVVVADGVGLGKTFLAGELIREAVEDRRQRVLVIAPAALRDGPWRAFQANQHFNFEVISFDQLVNDRQINPDRPGTSSILNHGLNEYSMVVVDEAHAYRNVTTQRAEALNRLLEGSPPKGVVLLTATPVNNSLWDLYNLLAYFVRNDATFAAAGIPSLRNRFRDAAAVDPEALDPEQLFDVLSPVVVRRTRSYVKHYYPNTQVVVNGELRRIAFPVSEVRPVTYDLSTVLPGFLDELALALDVASDDADESNVLTASERRATGEQVLTFARYAPSAYRRDGAFEPYEGQVAGLLRSGLLKRFESSSAAFASTCRTMAASHDDFLDLIDQNLVATGAALRELSSSDSDDLEQLLKDNEKNWKVEPAAQYDTAQLRSDVEADRDILLAWAQKADTVTAEQDPKLAALVNELATIAAEAAADVQNPAAEGDRRKVIVFSYFADTISWISDYLNEVVATDPRLAAYRGRVISVTGSDHDNQQRAAMFGFAPTTTEAPPGADDDLFDVMLATDVLAEGVNLQQARHIINYDLPWNPMRLVQRHGRIDRIGSPHNKVWMRCVMPDADLNRLLQLEQRLHRKIRQAARSIGVEGTIIPGSEVSDRNYTETRDAIEEIRRGDASFLEEDRTARSVEEYRQELRAGMNNPLQRREITQLAWGSGSGKAVPGAEPGFVFCARVGDNPDPHFRYVSLADPDEPVVVPDVLACLTHAYATDQTERVLDDATYEQAYDAWAAAKASIHAAWTYATDPRNLQPEVPAAMRAAVQVVEGYPPPGLNQAEVERLIDTLNAPYPERIRRQVRAITEAVDLSGEARSEAYNELVQRLALTPPEPPTPLPLASEDDIHLICWMAITPTAIVTPVP